MQGALHTRASDPDSRENHRERVRVLTGTRFNFLPPRLASLIRKRHSVALLTVVLSGCLGLALLSLLSPTVALLFLVFWLWIWSGIRAALRCSTVERAAETEPAD